MEEALSVPAGVRASAVLLYDGGARPWRGPYARAPRGCPSAVVEDAPSVATIRRGGAFVAEARARRAFLGYIPGVRAREDPVV